MRQAIFPVLLVLAILPVPVASAAPTVPTVDATDALDDARAYPDVRVAGTDIVRLTSKLEGETVVQTVHVVGPWPEDDHWVQVRNTLGGFSSYTMKVEWMETSGSNTRYEDHKSAHVSSADPALAGKRIEFTFERQANAMIFRWPVADLPAGACVNPHASTLSWTMVEGRKTQVDDEFDPMPSACEEGARTDGLDGSCDAPAPNVAKPAKLDDARGDVGEREGLGFKPHDDASLDILSLESRVEDGWIVQTVKLAERPLRDQVTLAVETQVGANKSEFEPGPRVIVRVFESGATGSYGDDLASTPIFASAKRVEPAGWELRWCASAIPADATCFAPNAVAQRDNHRYQDAVGYAKDPCGAAKGSPSDAPADADDTPATTTRDAGGSTDGGADDTAGNAETPGLGLVALLGALVLVALIRRA